jgi:hypothetical protein
MIVSLCSCQIIDTIQKPFSSQFPTKPQTSCEIREYQITGQNILNDAHLASIVYESDDAIQSFCKTNEYKDVHIALTSKYDVKFFTARKKGFQYIVIRGTSNYSNIKSDILAAPVYDALANIWLHKGFRDASITVFDHLQHSFPKINPDCKTIIIGHSLGGAIANILGIYLFQNHFSIDRIITFGQPKITNQSGLSAYSHLTLIRVVGEGDVIASVPPKTGVFNYVHGGLKLKIDDDSLLYSRLNDPSNSIDDAPVSQQMDITRASRALNHKISCYIQRLEVHTGKVITVK